MTETSPFKDPHLQYGYTADERPVERPGRAAPIDPERQGRDNRGRPAASTSAGEVVGSGASAGGKGGPEDYDSDPRAGGGAFILKHEGAKPDTGADASQHNST